MDMSQNGAGGRDQYNVSGNVYINNQGVTPTDSDPRQEDSDDLPQSDNSSDEGSSGGKGFWVALAGVAILIFGIVNSCSGSGSNGPDISFPAASSPSPSPAVRQQVLAPVTAWLASCAGQVVLSPLHCPQTASTSSGDDEVSAVRWTLHGDPGNGAVIRYSKGKFWILGHAVMTVTYNDSSGAEGSMDGFDYEVTVSLAKGRAVMNLPLRRVHIDGGPTIREQNPDIPVSEASALVMAKFKACAALHIAPLPAQCMGIGVADDNVTWTLTGNPVLNAAERFDPSTGLVHLTGNYSMTESYRMSILGIHGTYPYPGSYDAVLSMDHGHATLLGISSQLQKRSEGTRWTHPAGTSSPGP